MKKTNRIVALFLAVFMVFACFAGCADKEDYKNAVQGTEVGGNTIGGENDKDSSAALIAEIQAQIDSLEANLEAANASVKEVEEQMEGLKAQNNELKEQVAEGAKALEAANAEKVALESQKAALENEKTVWETEKAALEARIAALEAQVEPEVEFVDNKYFADLNYVLEDIIFIFGDGTAALKATTEGFPVYITSREVIGSQIAYPKNTVMLPREGYNYAVTYDCVNVYNAATGGNNQAYSYANGGLFLGEKLGTGYTLKDTTLRGEFGWTDDLLEAVIVGVENPASKYGVSFYVKVDNYAANPVYEPACKHGDGCHCGDCDKCPALEPEVIVKTEVKTEVVEKCPICKVQNCEGHCGRCNEYLSKCSCEPEIVIIPGQDIHWHWCSDCGYLKVNCICNNQENNTQRPDDGTFVPDAPADQPSADVKVPENNTQRPDDTVFAPDAPADQPPATTPENNKASGEAEFVTSTPADQPDSSAESSNANQTVDNGPADQPHASGDASQPTVNEGPVDQQEAENSKRTDDNVFA